MQPHSVQSGMAATPVQALTLTSPAFADGGPIPRRYTADGENLTPPLTWGEPPPGTESFALVCEDPDAPSGLFVHWIAWNLDPERRQILEQVPEQAAMQGLLQGQNGFGATGYGGPSPPPGKPHRYVFRLYALDTRLDLRVGASLAEFYRAIEAHVLAEGVLVGKYGR